MRAEQAAVDGYISRWRPSSVSSRAAAFAREVITAAGPRGQERAKNLLWAAGKLADYAIGLGLVPEVVLHPSVAERFTRCAPGLSMVARRICDGSRQLADRLLIRPARWARPVRRSGDRSEEGHAPSGQIRSESPRSPEPILAAVHPEPP